MAAEETLDLDALVNEVTGGSDSESTVRVTSGEASEAKAKSGLMA